MKSPRSGLTLLEVLIASAILSAVALLAFATLFSSTGLATKGSIASRLEERGIRFLSFCRDDMSAAQFSQSIPLGGNPANFSLGIPSGTPNAYNTAVGYRVPGNRNASGVAAPTLTVVYGYPSPFRQAAPAVDTGFYQDVACFLRFEAENVFREDGSSLNVTQAANWGTPFPAYPALTITPVTFDLNGDGDRTDAFVRGKIVKYVLAPTGSYLAGAHAPLHLNGTVMPSHLLSRETLSDNVLLRVNSTAAGDFRADVDGHGATNSGVIFGFADPATGLLNPAITSSPNAAGIHITIWHGDYDDTGKRFIVRKNSALIHFRPGSQG